MSTKNKNDTEYDFLDEYFSDVDINKKYSVIEGQNILVEEKSYEAVDGKRVKQIYADENGYIFTCYKKGNKVTCITVNKPHGNDNSQVIISRNVMEADGFSRSQRNKVLKDLPEQVAHGASLAEIYQNFQDYAQSGFPSSERPKDEPLQTQEPYYASDEDYYLGILTTDDKPQGHQDTAIGMDVAANTPQDRKDAAMDMKVAAALTNFELKREIEELTKQITSQEQTKLETNGKNDLAMLPDKVLDR